MLISNSLVALALLSAAFMNAEPDGATRTVRAKEIQYVSTDLRHVMIIANETARIGDELALSAKVWPSVPAQRIHGLNGVECLSLGSGGNTVEFAIRRPIKAGDRYSCLRSSFTVTRCFEECEAAVIEVERPLTGLDNRGTRKAYLYVDSCRGLLVASEVADLAKGIPVDAVWLRGEVGALADLDNPKCAVMN